MDTNNEVEDGDDDLFRTNVDDASARTVKKSKKAAESKQKQSKAVPTNPSSTKMTVMKKS